jgi:gluconate kinase
MLTIIGDIFSILTLPTVLGIALYLHNRQVHALNAEKNLLKTQVESLENKLNDQDAIKYERTVKAVEYMLSKQIEILKTKLDEKDDVIIEVTRLNNEITHEIRNGEFYKMYFERMQGGDGGQFATFPGDKDT